ncbi:hypothetical protein [Burkholderia sp. Ac-20353]|nr:hypothetical protein [Burkholderia sp. Ac-20353]
MTSQEVFDLIGYYFGGGALSLGTPGSGYTCKKHQNQGHPQ